MKIYRHINIPTYTSLTYLIFVIKKKKKYTSLASLGRY